MVFGLRRMAAKKHVTNIVDGGDRNPSLAQQFVGVAPGGAPERVKHNLQTRGTYEREVNDLVEPGQISGLGIDALWHGLGWARDISIRGDQRFNGAGGL